jgi:hypothetical protein
VKKLLISVLVLLVISIACSVNMGETTGGEIKNDEKGFSAVFPKGYETSSIFGELGATKKNADILEGPNFMVSIGPKTAINTPDQILDTFLNPNNNIYNYVYSGTRTPVTFSGITGLSVDFTGTTEEKSTPISGRKVVAFLQDGRYVQVDGHWPVKDQEESLKVFNSILNSIKFYEPILPTPSQ